MTVDSYHSGMSTTNISVTKLHDAKSLKPTRVVVSVSRGFSIESLQDLVMEFGEADAFEAKAKSLADLRAIHDVVFSQILKY